MPKVKVGGSPSRVSWAEYFCAIVPSGTVVEFERNRLLSNPSRGVGCVLHSWFFDGVQLEVELEGGEQVTVSPCIGDKIRRVKDVAAKAPFIGAGI